MEVIFAHVINGLAVGSIYALLATGFNLLLVVGGVFQFAYPHIVVMSMYISWMVLRVTGGNLALAIPAAIGSGVGLSVLTEPLFRPLVRRGATVATFVLAVGIGMILTDIMCRQIHAGIAIGFPTTLTGKEALVRFGIATLTRGQLFTILGSVFAVVGLLYLLYRTKQGRAFRAIAQSPFAARLLGIPIVRTGIYSYALSGLLGGLSAVFLAMALGAATGPLGGTLAVKVFAVTMFAGLGNLRGGLICGIILGVVESFAMGYLPGTWVNAIALGMVMVAVMWKPQGLFGVRA